MKPLLNQNREPLPLPEACYVPLLSQHISCLGKEQWYFFLSPLSLLLHPFLYPKIFLTSRKVTNAIHICCWVDRLYSFAFNVLAVQNIRSQPWVCSSHYEMYDNCLWNSISWFCKMESSWLNWEYWRIKGKLAKIKKKLHGLLTRWQTPG